MKKEGQAWGFDLVVGLVIFLIGITSLYLYTTNLSGDGEGTVRQLQQEGEILADSLMSEGSPSDWSASNVVRIGLISDGRVNQTKLDNFRNLGSTNYNYTKYLFRVRNEYYVYLDEQQASGIGNNFTNPTNLIKVTRAVVYNGTITSLNVNVWN